MSKASKKQTKRKAKKRQANRRAGHKATAAAASRAPAPGKRQVPAATVTTPQPRGFWKRLTAAPRLAKAYAIGAVILLLASTVFWSLLGAKINQSNADQLVNSYLFENAHTFQQAAFPAQHSFLLKWPLFWLIQAFHFSPGAFITATVATAVLTVGALAWMLYRLERRPWRFGTLCLALATVLLLVPTQPYAGGLLPVNMAMTTTRNLEYVLFAAALAATVRLRTWRSWRFWTVTGTFTLLIASDKLFLSLAAGGAILGGVIYILTKRFQLLRSTAYTLLACAVGAVAASTVLAFITATGTTGIPGSGNAPYQLALTAHSLTLGSIYALANLFTNFGANPAFDATVLSQAPRLALRHISSPALAGYAVNIVVVLVGLTAAASIVRHNLRRIPASTNPEDGPDEPAPPISRGTAFALSLVWAACAATGAFIITNHAFAVDARYIGLWLFALFACLAVWLRSRPWTDRRLAIMGAVLLLGVAGSAWGAVQNFHAETAALQPIQNRNQAVAQALTLHRTTILVGDYWRVIPTKAIALNKLTVMPLDSCSTARQTLTSKAWQPDLTNHSFAYLLSLDKGLTDFPACSLQQAIDAYGRPSSSVVVAGTVAQPKELLLFYDHGINHIPKEPDTPPQATASVIPLTLDKLPRDQTDCGDRPTVMNVVAHQDDDLLFMNPDLDHDITANHCVRTIYLTAGDSGNGPFYWLGRERGSQAAYDLMDGSQPDSWIQKIINVSVPGESTSQYITVDTPRNNPSISLIFFHLPDGGLGGDGFSSSHHESLAHLANGTLGQAHTVDGQSVYTASNLVATLTGLIRTYRPAEIRTQADYVSHDFPDHSDHITTGHFATQAQQAYQEQTGAAVPIRYYLGYPVREQPENIDGNDLDLKQTAFFAYGQFDGGVCHSEATCANVDTYYSYLRRQYQYSQP